MTTCRLCAWREITRWSLKTEKRIEELTSSTMLVYRVQWDNRRCGRTDGSQIRLDGNFHHFYHKFLINYPLGVTTQVGSSLFFFRKIKRDPGWSHPGDILFFFSRLEEFYYASSSFFVFWKIILGKKVFGRKNSKKKKNTDLFFRTFIRQKKNGEWK